ncbi:MAG: hypothetical protein Q8Q02_06365 [Nocardioides sp.]|nr:hypothetical protein [Nocardioides sp.]
MPAAAWVTIILATLIIAAAAIGLLRVILHLKSTVVDLDGVIGGVDAIAERTRTVPGVVDSVNASLKPVRDFTAAI